MDRTTSIKRFIVEEFAPEIAPSELDVDYDLLESGIIDSLGLLTVLAWGEDEFGVEIDTGEVGEDDFRSVRAICSLIESSSRTPQGTAG